MKFFNIVLGLMMFQLAIAFVNGMVAIDNLTITQYANITGEPGLISNINNTVSNSRIQLTQITEPDVTDIFIVGQMLISGFLTFVSAFVMAIFYPYGMMVSQLQMPPELALPLSMMIYVVYLVGLIQILLNRQFKQME